MLGFRGTKHFIQKPLGKKAMKADYYIVNLLDRTQPEEGWFQSDIDGTHDQCYAQVRALSLDLYFDIQIVEA